MCWLQFLYMEIKNLRLKMGLKQQEFAKMIGVAPVTLYRYENNILEPNINTLKKIATALSTNVDTVIGFDSPMLDLRKLTDTQAELVQAVIHLSPETEKQVLGYIQGLTNRK